MWEAKAFVAAADADMDATAELTENIVTPDWGDLIIW